MTAVSMTPRVMCFLAIGALLGAADYQHEISQWRADREKRLKADDGWLTVVGLDWLKEGENRVGSNPDFEVPLPKTVPERVGVITFIKGKSHFKPQAGVAVA